MGTAKRLPSKSTKGEKLSSFLNVPLCEELEKEHYFTLRGLCHGSVHVLG